MTTTGEARVTDEEITLEVVLSRNDLERGWNAHQRLRNSVIVALDDRLAARDAERAEMVALLESYGHDINWSNKMEAMLAKLRGGTP